MPKATFFNLPLEKREHITAVAVAEFADHDYPDVSISRIVARAGIAKGSFYQYFEDKEDLYSYLFDTIAEKKAEMFSLDHPDPQQLGVFRYLHWMAQAAVEFELAYPELMRIGARALRRNGFLDQVQGRYRPQALAFYKQLIVRGKEQGDIAPEIDEELAAFVFETLFTALSHYLRPLIAAHHNEGSSKTKFFELPEVRRIFDQTVDILESGMGRARAERGAAPHPGRQEVSHA